MYNALAGKVYYDAYKNNEKNLKGKVGIAEGLLSTSTVLKLQDITWKTDNGQGEYKVATPPPAPKNEGPITKDETFTEDRTIKGTMNNARMVIGGGFGGDVYGGVAVFAKDNNVKVEMAGHNLDIQMSGFNNNHDIYGIYAGNQKKINITNETATGGKKGAITMSLDNSADDAGHVYGIYANKAKVSIDGDVTITKAVTTSGLSLIHI